MNLPRPGAVPWSWLRESVVRWHQRPQASVDLGRTVPAWALRLAAAVVAVACTALVASDVTHWLLAIGAIAALVLWPDGGAPTVFVVGVGLGVLALGPEPFDLRVPALVLGLHLVLHLATVVGDLPWTGAVEAEVLTAGARPFVAIQAFVQASALVGAGVSAREVSVPALPVAAGLLLAVVAWAVVARLRAEP